MRIFFVVPGDRVELLEDTKFVDTGWSEVKMETIPKGTVLEVSQVYIRNHGYFLSSLTFKFSGGPGYDLFIQSENNRKLQALKDTHEHLLKEIKDLDDHDADFHYIEHTSGGRRIDTPYRPPETLYKKGTFAEYEAFIEFRPSRGYISYSYHKTQLQDLVEKAGHAVNTFKPKTEIPKNFCRVIRVPLAEIEKWEIKLLHRIPKQNQ
jgi:hypothetical protein